MKSDLFSPIVIATALGGSFLAYDHLAPEIPIHWGIDGRIDYTVSKRIGVYLNPAAMVFTYLFFWMITYVDRARVRRLRDVGIYDVFRDGAVCLFGFAHLLALGIGLRWASPEANFLVGAASISILVAGLHFRQPPHGKVFRLLRRLGITPCDPAAKLLCRSVIAAGAAGVFGTLSGRAQIAWLLLPLAAGLLWTRRRFSSGSPPG